jgi:hypothetical protein
MIGIYPPLEWLSELAAREHEEPAAPDRIGETAGEAAGKEVAPGTRPAAPPSTVTGRDHAESKQGAAGAEQSRD